MKVPAIIIIALLVSTVVAGCKKDVEEPAIGINARDSLRPAADTARLVTNTGNVVSIRSEGPVREGLAMGWYYDFEAPVHPYIDQFSVFVGYEKEPEIQNKRRKVGLREDINAISNYGIGSADALRLTIRYDRKCRKENTGMALKRDAEHGKTTRTYWEIKCPSQTLLLDANTGRPLNAKQGWIYDILNI